MNYKMMGRLIAQILLAEAAFMVPALIISLVGHDSQAILGFALSILVILAVAGMLMFFARKAKKGFYAREGMVCVGLAWIVMSLLGCLPFWISREIPSYLDGLFEIVRTFYKFAPNGTPCTSSYEYREYKQTGIVRWCTDEGYRASSYCTLYPENLPEAWKDTPMKYSALEILSENRPSEQIYYAKAINRYREFPQLEWFIKMRLYKLAAHLINEYHDGAFGYESRNGV